MLGWEMVPGLRFLRFGSEEELQYCRPGTRVVFDRDRRSVPGLADSHWATCGLYDARCPDLLVGNILLCIGCNSSYYWNLAKRKSVWRF